MKRSWRLMNLTSVYKWSSKRHRRILENINARTFKKVAVIPQTPRKASNGETNTLRNMSRLPSNRHQRFGVLLSFARSDVVR